MKKSKPVNLKDWHWIERKAKNKKINKKSLLLKRLREGKEEYSKLVKKHLYEQEKPSCVPCWESKGMIDGNNMAIDKAIKVVEEVL